MQALGSQKDINNLINSELRAKLKHIQIKARRSVDSGLMGSYRSAFRGSGLIFSDLREYQAGDEIRHINWKVSARSGRIYVKSYEEDRNLNLVLALDLSRSTLFGSERNKQDRALQFSALLSLLALHNRDSISLALFGSKIEEFIGPSSRRSQIFRLWQKLLESRDSFEQTDLSNVLSQLSSRLKRRSIIFLLSDFYSSPYNLDLKRLSSRHEVICVLLQDALDLELPTAGLVQLQAAEGAQSFILDSSSSRVRASLRKAYEEHRDSLQKMCRECGADFMLLDKDPLSPLAELMRRRTKHFR